MSSRSNVKRKMSNGGDEDDDEVYTLQELLEQEEEFEETAAAIIGGSDNENCSYEKGYVKRQAIYACLTCTSPNDPDFVPAGLCLACSLKCHDGHELEELYTKRNFRCDCGNKKFPDTPCTLTPEKEDFNENNYYNHNFKGMYCTCNRPYPDPEDPNDKDSMINCVICEDWYHGRHIKNDDLDFEVITSADFTCESCVDKCDFLAHYTKLRVLKADDVELTTIPETKDRETSAPAAAAGGSEPDLNVDTVDSPAPQSNGVCVTETETAKNEKGDSNHNSSVTNTNGTEKSESSWPEGGDPHSQCLLDESQPQPYAEKGIITGGAWWKLGWRSELCKCEKCKCKYESLNVGFLVDGEDDLDIYEAKGKDMVAKIQESGNAALGQALASLDRVAQIEVISEFNEMKEALSGFFNDFASRDQVVRADDVAAFFSELKENAAKRRRLNGQVPWNCR